MDYELQRCTRHCAVSGRELTPGEEFYSTILVEDGVVVRKDYSSDGWIGPPEGAIGWWKSQMPGQTDERMRWAPNDVMLQFFEELAHQPDKGDMRYVLALLLVRRRVMRLDGSEQDEEGREVLTLYCPRRQTTYKVRVVTPDDRRIEEIQEELARLLFANAT